jgi:hypothetical protein
MSKPEQNASTTPPAETNAGEIAAAAKKMYKVWDKNQRGEKARVHDVIVKMYDDGREPDLVSYQLFSDTNKACLMPMEHAMKFLSDAAFIVQAPSGNRIMPVAKLDLSKPIQVLAEDEIVVKYEELSKESLMRRVKVLPGSEDIKESAKLEELVAFMVNWRRRMRGMTDGDKVLAEKMAAAGQDAMTAEQLENMFPARRAA